MIQITKDRQALLDDLMGLEAFDVDHEADATGIMLVLRVVKTLSLRNSVSFHFRSTFLLKTIYDPDGSQYYAATFRPSGGERRCIAQKYNIDFRIAEMISAFQDSYLKFYNLNP
jgi:hypothetical protein